MKIIGQDKLCNKIDSLTTANFPHTVMLVGEKGSGKHLFVTYIAQHLHLDRVFFNTTITLEEIEDIQLSPLAGVYVFSDLSIKDQNQLLKFLEEPVSNAFIILLAEYKDFYLPTIINRCQVWTLDKYDFKILKQFNQKVDFEIICQCCNTPGQVIELSSLDVSFITNLIDKIIHKISIASYGNLFNISDKLEKNNIDIDVFVRLLKYFSKKEILDFDSDCNYVVYKLISRLESELKIPHINKLQLLEHYLFQIRSLYDTTRA